MALKIRAESTLNWTHLGQNGNGSCDWANLIFVVFKMPLFVDVKTAPLIRAETALY